MRKANANYVPFVLKCVLKRSDIDMSKSTLSVGYSCVKGSVLKSTTTINTALALANNLKKKVLVIDFDPQGSASLMVNLPIDNPEANIRTIGDLLFENLTENIPITADEIKKIIYRPEFPVKRRTRVDNKFVWEDSFEEFGFDVMPASMQLSMVELLFTSPLYIVDSDKRYNKRINPQTLLRKVVDIAKDEFDYDYILIDSVPSLSALSVNVLAASDYLVIPTTMTYLSAVGVGYVQEVAEQIARMYRRDIKVLGIVENLYRDYGAMDNYIDNYIANEYPDLHVFTTKIPPTTEAEKMLIEGKVSSHANKELKTLYEELAQELVDRIKFYDNEKID